MPLIAFVNLMALIGNANAIVVIILSLVLITLLKEIQKVAGVCKKKRHHKSTKRMVLDIQNYILFGIICARDVTGPTINHIAIMA